MSVSPEDLLQFARSIRAEESEAAQRAGISRAYYAAYHACQFIAQYCPLIERGKEGEHLYLIRRFTQFPRKGQPGASLAREIGSLLAKAKSLRTDADYTLGIAVHSQQLNAQIARVEEIANLVEQFRKQQMGVVQPDQRQEK